MKQLFATLVVLLLTVTLLSAQTKWFAIPGAPTTGGGHAWADPIDLQTAINTAVAGDSVFVAQGIYQPASGQSFTMKEGVKIYGGFAGTETSLGERNLSAGYTSKLQGNNARVVNNTNNGLSAAAVLDGFFITQGSATPGAGMMNSSASPTISRCVFYDNTGGGLYNAFSTATITGCVFTENHGSKGGGMVNMQSPVLVINCVFSGNVGDNGGGMYIEDLAPSPRIINCTFWNNFSGGAGGIYGAARARPEIRNCVIWGNSVGGVKLSSPLRMPVIFNNIIQGGYIGNLNIDPHFVNTGNPAGPDNIWGTADDGLALLTSSPVANGGISNISSTVLPVTDITGASRIQGNKIDMGAYESGFTCSGYATLYVDSSIAASGDGGSWATAFKTLDEALIAAEQCNGVNIHVAKGTYQPGAALTFMMVSDAKIYGGFPNGGGSFAQRNTTTYTTILKGTGKNVFYNYQVNAAALLDGLTITGGAGNYGGGVYNNRSSPAFNNCIFRDITISANGGTGGAMNNDDGSSPLITNTLFARNTASNTTVGGGGAIFNTNSSPVINRCIFENNAAAFGGAIYNYFTPDPGAPPASPVISNSIFVGNVTRQDGAIASGGTSMTLRNVTFVNNTSGRGGGAIDHYAGDLTATNLLFWGNTATTYNDIWWETGSTTLNLQYCFTQATWAGTGNMVGSSSPFVDITNPAGVDGIWNTADDGLRLAPGSPAINAGTPDTTGMDLGNTDLAGNARIIGTAIDLGAYEYDNTSLPITLLNFKGNLYNGMANLQWQTGEESNFSHFEVEKSTDGVLYRMHDKVTGKGSYSTYTLSTAQQEPTAYYRLKQVDLDNRHEYSRILILSQRAGNSILVYPNPTTNHLYIQSPNAGSMAIYTAEGKLVRTELLQAGVNTIEVRTLRAGLYYGLINGRQVRFIKK